MCPEYDGVKKKRILLSVYVFEKVIRNSSGKKLKNKKYIALPSKAFKKYNTAEREREREKKKT